MSRLAWNDARAPLQRADSVDFCHPAYIVFELPSNMLMRKIGCRVWLSFITIAWGSVMLGMAFLTNWHQLAACRVLLGILEAGFFPG